MAGEFQTGYQVGADIGEGIVERRRKRRFNEAYAAGDVQQAGLIDADRLAEQQALQAQQKQVASQEDVLRRQATVRAATAAKNLAARTGDHLGAFDTVARVAGKTFAPEDLAEARALLEQQGPEAFDTLIQAASDPSEQKAFQPTRPFEIQQDGRTVLATYGPGGEVRVIGEAPPPKATGAAADPLTAELRRAQIMETQSKTASRDKALQQKEEAAQAKATAKKEFAASSVANGLRAVDTALAFFGTDADGDGVISDEERKGGLLDARNEKGVAKTVGALRRRVDEKIPGSDIALLKQQIKPLQSNIGLDRLVELKSSGATLGAVSNFELQTLQTTLANLEQVDDPEQLFRDLNFIRSMFSKIEDNLAQDGYTLGDIADAPQGDPRLSDYTDEELEEIAAGMR